MFSKSQHRGETGRAADRWVQGENEVRVRGVLEEGGVSSEGSGTSLLLHLKNLLTQQIV